MNTVTSRICEAMELYGGMEDREPVLRQRIARLTAEAARNAADFGLYGLGEMIGLQLEQMVDDGRLGEDAPLHVSRKRTVTRPDWQNFAAALIFQWNLKPTALLLALLFFYELCPTGYDYQQPTNTGCAAEVNDDNRGEQDANDLFGFVSFKYKDEEEKSAESKDALLVFTNKWEHFAGSVFLRKKRNIKPDYLLHQIAFERSDAWIKPYALEIPKADLPPVHYTGNNDSQVAAWKRYRRQRQALHPLLG